MATTPPSETPVQPTRPVQPDTPPPEINVPGPDVDFPSPGTMPNDPGTSQPAEIWEVSVDDDAAPVPDEPTTAGAHAVAASDKPSLADEEERPASRVGARSLGGGGDVGGTDSMPAETGGLAGTSR